MHVKILPRMIFDMLLFSSHINYCTGYASAELKFLAPATQNLPAHMSNKKFEHANTESSLLGNHLGERLFPSGQMVKKVACEKGYKLNRHGKCRGINKSGNQSLGNYQSVVFVASGMLIEA